MRRVIFAVAVALGSFAACGGDDEEAPTAPTLTGFGFTQGGVSEGQPIDARYSCDGEDVSPELSWEGAPAEAAELVLVVDDPDAPGGTFTHWLLYGLDPGVTSLPQNVPDGGDVAGPPALRQGKNDFGTTGYGGPCPPAGETHDYVFRLYALDEETGLQGGAGADEVRAAIKRHAIAEATLTAPYSRSSR